MASISASSPGNSNPPLSVSCAHSPFRQGISAIIYAKFMDSHAKAKDALLWWCADDACNHLGKFSILVLLLSNVFMLGRDLTRHFEIAVLLTTCVTFCAPQPPSAASSLITFGILERRSMRKGCLPISFLSQSSLDVATSSTFISSCLLTLFQITRFGLHSSRLPLLSSIHEEIRPPHISITEMLVSR